MSRPSIRSVCVFVAAALVAWGPAVACSGADVGRQEAGAGGVASTQGPLASLMEDLSVLAADSMGGRAVGTPGNAAARRYLVNAFGEMELEPLGDGYEHPFTFPQDGVERRGVNVVGYVAGSVAEGPWMVVTAHFDHLGTQDGRVFNGADDNASGTAGLLAISRALAADPPSHPVVLAALDAEEMGLQGARALVAAPPPGLSMERVALNVNLDMISRNDSVLFVAGTYHYPFLEAPMRRAGDAAQVVLRFGHDRPDLPPGDDWTNASDHGPFHQAGIPFVYFGVEDHPDYHQPTDDPGRIDPDFYERSVRTVLAAIRELDSSLPEIARAAGRP